MMFENAQGKLIKFLSGFYVKNLFKHSSNKNNIYLTQPFLTFYIISLKIQKKCYEKADDLIDFVCSFDSCRSDSGFLGYMDRFRTRRLAKSSSPESFFIGTKMNGNN